MSKNSVSFRGHTDKASLNKVYNGHFLTQVQLLAKYDKILEQVLSMSHGHIKYVSPKIQNEITECLASRLKSTLFVDINSAPFNSIIMDTTQDITKKDQLSKVIRFVNKTKTYKNKPTLVDIKEVFLGFNEVRDHTEWAFLIKME